MGKVKSKRPDAAACDQYSLAKPHEEVFVTKEYLSKELLQYLLNLELCPTIENSLEMPKE